MQDWYSGCKTRLRKAFDTLCRNGCLSIAWKLGIRGKPLNIFILNSLYDNVQSNVRFGNISTDFLM